LRYCRTKIVCTLGPATATREAIRSLVDAGLNVARVNFSHSTHEQHAETIATVRSVAESCGRPIAILGDLQGPKIRIGDLPAPRELADGTDLTRLRWSRTGYDTAALAELYTGHHARADLIDPRRPAPTRSTRRLRGGVTGLQ